MQICRRKFKSFLKVYQKGRHSDALTSGFKKDLRSAKIQDVNRYLSCQNKTDESVGGQSTCLFYMHLQLSLCFSFCNLNSVTIIINHRCLFLFSICILGSNKKKLNLSWNVYSYLSAYIFNSLKIIIHHLVIFAMKRVTFCLCLPSSYL